MRAEVCRSDTRWPRRRPQRYWWRLIADNGRIMAVSSEMYTNEQDARSALETVCGAHLDHLVIPETVVHVPRSRR